MFQNVLKSMFNDFEILSDHFSKSFKSLLKMDGPDKWKWTAKFQAGWSKWVKEDNKWNRIQK